MNEYTAQSEQLVENGYLDWLCAELRELSRMKFEAADAEDIGALTRAKVSSDLVAEIRQVVRTNARRV